MSLVNEPLDPTILDRAERRYGERTEHSAEQLLSDELGFGTEAYWAHLNALMDRMRPKCLICGFPVTMEAGKGTPKRYCDSTICDAERKRLETARRRGRDEVAA